MAGAVLRDQETPEVAAQPWASGWGFDQSFVCVLNREDEVEAEPVRLALVEVRRREELVLRFG